MRLEGFEGSAGNAGAVGGKGLDAARDSTNVADIVDRVPLVSDDYEDVTDWNTPGFRYRY